MWCSLGGDGGISDTERVNRGGRGLATEGDARGENTSGVLIDMAVSGLTLISVFVTRLVKPYSCSVAAGGIGGRGGRSHALFNGVGSCVVLRVQPPGRWQVQCIN